MHLHSAVGLFAEWRIHLYSATGAYTNTGKAGIPSRDTAQKLHLRHCTYMRCGKYIEAMHSQ